MTYDDLFEVVQDALLNREIHSNRIAGDVTRAVVRALEEKAAKQIAVCDCVQFMRSGTHDARCAARLAELVCPECDSRVMDNGYCMLGHWCGKPLK
jgi:hypothetical protein